MVWRLASGRRTFRRRIGWRPHCALERSGLTATTSSTRHCHLVATSSPVGDARWAKTFSHSTPRPSRSARGSNTAPQDESYSGGTGVSPGGRGRPALRQHFLIAWRSSLLACFLLLVRQAIRKCRSEEHTSELQSHLNLVCRLLLEKKKK